MKSIRDFKLAGKKVIIRCDFNVPMKDGKIVDDTRIVESLATIKYARDHHAKIILLSHLGRVKEEQDLAKNTLRPVYHRLKELLDQEVLFSPKTRGSELEKMVDNLKEKEILLIENTRYEDLVGKKESGNDKALGAYWASLGDLFINDAFGTAHRSHASNVGIASYLPSGIGFLMEKELQVLSSLEKPDHPFVVILGGAKVKDKIKVIEHLATKADYILIGGGMAFTFLKALNIKIGKSLLDEEHISFCKKMLEQYKEKFVLPIDVVTSKELSDTSEKRLVEVEEIKEDEMGLDIGEATVRLFEEKLKIAKTIVWNGPLGAYEVPDYSKGTEAILKYLSKKDANIVLGGGDIVAASHQLGYKDKVGHASTGGGATLEYLEGKDLPGIKVIEERS